MELLPAEIIRVDGKKLGSIEGVVKKIYRLIMFSRLHSDDDLLDSYSAAMIDLKTLLSVKNAQMEAQTEEEAARYIEHLNQALDFIFGEISAHRVLTREVQLFHLFRLISPETSALHPNRYRDRLVQVGEHLCPEPGRVPQLMSELFYRLETIPNAILRAFYFHHELVRIHPFLDGNGRTARIGKNWILMHELYPPVFIKDLAAQAQYRSTLAGSFRELMAHPGRWNPHTEAFFGQEIDLLLESATQFYDTINRIGRGRESGEGR